MLLQEMLSVDGNGTMKRKRQLSNKLVIVSDDETNYAKDDGSDKSNDDTPSSTHTHQQCTGLSVGLVLLHIIIKFTCCMFLLQLWSPSN